MIPPLFEKTFDLYSLQSNTHLSAQHMRNSIAHAKAAEADTEREQRLKERLCATCFYLRRGRLVGQAFTEWRCCSCNCLFMHHNTGTPRLCDECGDTHQACVECGADLHLTRRRALVPKVTRQRAPVRTQPIEEPEDSDAE